MKCNVKKQKGIEEFVKAYDPDKVEEDIPIQVEESTFSLLMHNFERILNMYRYLVLSSERKYEIAEMVPEARTPTDINAILLATTKYETHPNYRGSLGFLSEALIRKSYEAGYNGFDLDFPRPPKFINSFYGEEDNPIILNVNEIGSHCLGSSHNVKITCKGNVGSRFAHDASQCRIIIHGNAGDGFADEVCESEITIHGDVDYQSAVEASNSTFTVFGDIGKRFGMLSFGCDYRTPNLRTLDKMRRIIPEENRIIYIHPDGGEEIARDFS